MVAAYQAPLSRISLPDALYGIEEVVRRCEKLGVRILCCPEAILGGLADDAPDPATLALGRDEVLGMARQLASKSVTSIVGYTECGGDERLFNAAAVLSDGRIVGSYRKRYPARRASVYEAGIESPLFHISGATIGILICNDTNHPELAAGMVSAGAQALFVPSNNALPHASADVVEATRTADVFIARQSGVPVVRADVAGKDDGRTAFGTSAIIAAGGTILRAATPLAEDLLVSEIDLRPEIERVSPES
jgi:5-aminopentanamidase